MLWSSEPQLPQTDPLLGWRLWRVGDEALVSWGVRHQWQPGANRASCLSSRHCDPAPGHGCNCGFWAMFSPEACRRYARSTITDRCAAMGLVRAWGEVILHGAEGFRAQHATVVCLFTDWMWDLDGTGGRSAHQAWRRHLQRVLALIESPPESPAAPRDAFLRRTASAYGVPLLSLGDALASGFLSEQGVPERTLAEVGRAGTRGGRSRCPRSGPALGRQSA